MPFFFFFYFRTSKKTHKDRNLRKKSFRSAAANAWPLSSGFVCALQSILGNGPDRDVLPYKSGNKSVLFFFLIFWC